MDKKQQTNNNLNSNNTDNTVCYETYFEISLLKFIVAKGFVKLTFGLEKTAVLVHFKQFYGGFVPCNRKWRSLSLMEPNMEKQKSILRVEQKEPGNALKAAIKFILAELTASNFHSPKNIITDSP